MKTEPHTACQLTQLPFLEHTNLELTLDLHLLPIHHLIYHTTSKLQQPEPICKLNTFDLFQPMVPVALPLSPVLDYITMLDPPPAVDHPPTPSPIKSTTRWNSLSPWVLTFG
jgi:hypothetical protein